MEKKTGTASLQNPQPELHSRMHQPDHGGETDIKRNEKDELNITSIISFGSSKTLRT
jgi:hypothetical protein